MEKGVEGRGGKGKKRKGEGEAELMQRQYCEGLSLGRELQRKIKGKSCSFMKRVAFFSHQRREHA